MNSLNNRIAVVGTEVLVGSVVGLTSFDDHIYHGKTPASLTLEPNISQHQLVKYLVSGAFASLEGNSKSLSSLRTALVLVTGERSSAANRELVTITSELNENLPSFLLVSTESTFAQGLAKTRSLLRMNSIDAVCFVSLSNTDHVEQLKEQGIPFVFGNNQSATAQKAEGGVAFVLQRHLAAVKSGNAIFANIDSDAISENGSEAVTQAHSSAARPLEYLTQLDVNCANAASRPKLMRLLQQARIKKANADQHDDETLHCALSSVSCSFGDLGEAAPALSLLKTVICLRQRYVAGVPNWSGFQEDAQWADSPFYVAQDSRYWFVNGNRPRVAAMHAIDQRGRHQHLVVSAGNAEATASPLLDKNQFFLPIAANSELEFHGKLNALTDALAAMPESAEETSRLVQETIGAFAQQQNSKQFSVVLLGKGIQQIISEINAFRSVIEKLLGAGRANAETKRQDWRTPTGSFFTAKPVGDLGLAFAFPGIGMTYTGVAQHLHRYFPEIYQRNDSNGVLWRMLQQHVLYPREKSPRSAKERKQWEDQQRKKLSSLATVGVGVSKLYSEVLQDSFNIKPKHAFGYSMGEVSMWSGLAVWDEPELLIERINSNPVFQNQITGDLNAVRKCWQMSEQPEWDSFTLKADYRDVLNIMPENARAYLSVVNGDTCVLAGEPKTCKGIAKALSCSALASGFITAIHTEPAKSQYNHLLDMFDLSMNKPQSIRFYSAADLDPEQPIKPVLQTRPSIAKSVASAFTQPLYYSTLVEKVYEQGARLFIEVGASRSSTTLINKILEKKDHHAVPVDNRGQSEQQALLSLLAQLLSHGVKVNLQPLQRQPFPITSIHMLDNNSSEAKTGESIEFGRSVN